MKHYALLTATIFFSFWASTTANAQTALTGVWRTSEIVRTGPDAETISPAQPGLVIFTAGFYSIVRVNSDGPRPDLGVTDLDTASADELRAVYGPITAQAGTYEIHGGNVTLRPQTAKNTFVMAPGTFTTYSFSVEGDTLTMTNLENDNGPAENPTTITYSRAE